MSVETTTRQMLALKYGQSSVLQKIPMLEGVARNVNLVLWGLSGRPVPPPGLFKARTIKRYARRYGLRCFVETGTYRGGMVAAVKQIFDEIYSIELSAKLHAFARERFREDGHVRLICGDSGEELPRVVEALTGRALFWLDAHYSGGETANGTGGNPIIKEITCILMHRKDHVILVDDMRLFGTDPSYPTRRVLLGGVKESAGEQVMLDIKDDILRITPVLAVRKPGGVPEGNC